ncbi:MAG: DUF2461 domain-containing protein [Anaerolineae bacterium]|nr:DUF2461 domain-containing protein [Anaerolineae bacterium]
MPNNPYITPQLFDFFRELKDNNNREWFQANKNRYEAQVREPLLQFITDFGLRLAEISPHYVADARKSGGSLFRINRDVRFSKDKSPYKTQAGIQFRHEAGKDVHAPGFYLHLEPGSVFCGVGIWHPETKTLNQIRDAIVDSPDTWQAAVNSGDFTDTFTLAGDSLKRAPKGYDPDHPLIDDLRRKDFIATTEFSEADACASDFIDRFAGICRTSTPFMAFLTRSLGLPW